MPKRILIPLDGSELGEAALRYVEELIFTLSAEEKVEITLLQVLFVRRKLHILVEVSLVGIFLCRY